MKEPKQQSIELGEGGLKIIRHGVETLADECTNTQSGVTASLSYLTKAFSVWDKLTRSNGAKVSATQLKLKFGDSPISPALDDNDWESLAEVFSAKGRNRPTGKSAAFAYVRRKTGLGYATLRTYKSREK